MSQPLQELPKSDRFHPVVTVVKPAPGTSRLIRVVVWLRSLFIPHLVARLVDRDVVVLEGRIIPVKAVPLGVARDLIPAIMNYSKAIVACEVTEVLYDDLIIVLTLGLGMPKRSVERLTTPIWSLVKVLDVIARANGLLTVEAGRSVLGKPMMASTGTSFMPGSSMPPAGPGSTSTNA